MTFWLPQAEAALAQVACHRDGALYSDEPAGRH
jgi:hypothetical protein